MQSLLRPTANIDTELQNRHKYCLQFERSCQQQLLTSFSSQNMLTPYFANTLKCAAHPSRSH